MRYAAIRPIDVSNGEGLGVALFTQGCPIHCKGCFQPETWDFNGGKEFTQETIDKIIGYLRRPGITRFSILGGEPLIDQNLEGLHNLLYQIHKENISVKKWLYTGHTLSNFLSLRNNFDYNWIIAMVDIVVVGPFIEEEKDLGLKWRGSRNQMIIEVEDLIKNPLKYTHMLDI